MELRKTDFDGLYIIKRKVFSDSRGVFTELFREEPYREILNGATFVQDNFSMSHKGVVRGLHYQVAPFAQAKLITCLQGAIFDAVLDVRSKSATYGKVFTLELSEENGLSLFVPEGFAHGFQALQDNSAVMYKCTGYYSAISEKIINPFDVGLQIDWPISKSFVSAKDIKAESWKKS